METREIYSAEASDRAHPEDQRAPIPGLERTSENESEFWDSDNLLGSDGESSSALRAACRIVADLNRVDMRDLDYVDGYDENLMCPICRCPYIDPVMLEDCGHCFCMECLERWRSQSVRARLGECPSCRISATVVHRSATSKILANLIGNLLVKCPRREDGCTEHIRRTDIRNHVSKYCEFAFTTCPVEQCWKPVRTKRKWSGCLHHDVSCLDCRAELQVCDLEMHWRKACKKRPIACRLCNEVVDGHDQLEEHVRDTCLMASVTCPGGFFGCEYRDLRLAADRHIRGCVLAKLRPAWKKQEDQLDLQRKQHELLSRKIDDMSDGLSDVRTLTLRWLHQSRLNKKAASAQSASQHPAIGSAPMSLEPADLTSMTSVSTSDTPIDSSTGLSNSHVVSPYSSPLHHLLSMHEALREELTHVSATLTELDGRHSMQTLNENLRTRDEIAFLGAQVGSLQRQVHWLTSAQLQQQQGQTGRGATVEHPLVSPASSAAAAAAAVSGVEGRLTRAMSSDAAGPARSGQMGFSDSGGNVRQIGARRVNSEEGRTKL